MTIILYINKKLDIKKLEKKIRLIIKSKIRSKDQKLNLISKIKFNIRGQK